MKVTQPLSHLTIESPNPKEINMNVEQALRLAQVAHPLDLAARVLFIATMADVSRSAAWREALRLTRGV